MNVINRNQTKPIITCYNIREHLHMFTVKRSPHNPLLSPERSHPWEAAAAFNGSPIVVGKKTILLYRALSEPERLREPHIRMSVIGKASSNDGGDHFTDRRMLVGPSED